MGQGQLSQVILVIVLCISSMQASSDENIICHTSESTFYKAEQITNGCRLRDSLVLVDFYKLANGPNWTIKWDLDTPIETWYGITLNETGCVECIDLDGRAACDVSVSLGNMLSGYISPKIGELRSLKTLYLGNNRLTGMIPESIFRLPLIEAIDIFANEMIGPLPMSIGSAPQLVFLSLAGNNLSGSIPREIGDLKNLTDLYLDNNNLIGLLPKEIGKATSLERLRLHNNGLTGGIPAEIGELANLVNVNIAENYLNGKLPKEIGQLKNLKDLILANNNMSSDIPVEIGGCKALVRLRLCHNEFIGPLPESIGELNNLEVLLVNDNNLTGVIPTQLGNCLMLADLQLDENQFGGEIPTELGNLVNLRKLNLSENGLIGPLPKSLGGNLLKLQELKFHDNNISGPLPTEMGDLPSLRAFHAFNNSIIGPLPLSVIKLERLTQMLLQNNKIDGTVPEEFGLMPALNKLDLSNNFVSGCFPESLLSKCDSEFNFESNHQLPWEGSFEQFCSDEIQIGAPCSTSPDIDNESIQDDCSCKLIVCAPTSIITDAFICTNEVLSINGLQISEAGQFIDTLTNTGGCDSVVIINVAQMKLDIETRNTQCANESTGTAIISSNWAGLFDYVVLDQDNQIILEGNREEALPILEDKLNQGTYKLILSEANMGCSIDTSFTINSDHQPAEVTYIEEVRCEGETMVINGITFDENNTEGIVDLSTLNGCDSSVVIQLTYVTLDINKHDVTCEADETGYISGEFNLSNSYSYKVKDNTGQILLSDNLNEPQFETQRSLRSGTYTIEVETEFGCTYNFPINIDFEFAEPEPHYIEEILCPDEEIIINGVSYSYQNKEGSEELKTNQGCDSMIVVNLDFLEMPEPNDDQLLAVSPQSVIDILSNDNIDLNDNLEISIIAIDKVNDAEIIDGKLEINIDESYTGQSTVTYEICNIECDDLCTEATVYIESKGGQFDEDILTPNDDGHNDVLIVTGYEQFEEIPNSSLNVVNRWGQIVFSSENYTNDWTGNLHNDNSKPLPEGVYYYHIVLFDGSSKMGSRSLLR